MIPKSLAFDMLFGSAKLDAWEAIDKIYESFEYRCIDCRFYTEDEEEMIGHCWKGVNDGSDDTNYQVADCDVVEPDFGCVRFEPYHK